MWSKIPLDPRELNLAAVLRCGQSFRWAQNDDTWSICLQNRVLFVKQDAANLYYRSVGPGNKLSDLDLVRDYFNLDIELGNLYQTWKDRDSSHFKKTHYGVRILRQDPWETLCAFICSSNNNIKRISKMVQSLCTEFGKHVITIDGTDYHDFPTPHELAAPASKVNVEQRLRELGFGYRAKYISQTAQLLTEKPEGYLNALRIADTEAAVEALQEFAGVGPKVADCVSLMSLDKHEVVPIDTHMFQIASRDYNFKSKNYKSVQEKLKDIWGEHAGWAHSVLFAGDLPSLDNLKREHVETSTENVTKVEIQDPDSGVKEQIKRRKINARSTTSSAKAEITETEVIEGDRPIKVEEDILVKA